MLVPLVFAARYASKTQEPFPSPPGLQQEYQTAPPKRRTLYRLSERINSHLSLLATRLRILNLFAGSGNPSARRWDARYDIPAASRGNWGKVLGLLAYLAAKTKGDQACQVKAMHVQRCRQGKRQPRSLKSKAGLPELESGLGECAHPSERTLETMSRLSWH